MKIAYGVHGYSRGHATRALSVLQSLSERHEVMVLAGGDAYDLLAPQFPVKKIPCLGFSYRGKTRSNWQTLCDNAPSFIDLFRHGRSVQQVSGALRDFGAEAVISDAEPWTHRAAQRLRIPRIGFDHFGILVHCRVGLPSSDWAKGLVDRFMYRFLTRSPEKVLVSSFFRAEPMRPGVEIIGPILREQVRSAQATRGKHLLAYFNQGTAQVSDSVLDALAGSGLPVKLYGTQREGEVGNLQFRPAGLQPFLGDLASCRAVVSTAGNQLVGEAMALAKPILAIPETTVEQRLNAREIVRLGIGEQTGLEELSASVIKGFLTRSEGYARRALVEARDGQSQAVEILERWFRELSQAPARSRWGKALGAPVSAAEASVCAANVRAANVRAANVSQQAAGISSVG